MHILIYPTFNMRSLLNADFNQTYIFGNLTHRIKKQLKTSANHYSRNMESHVIYGVTFLC